MPGRPFISSSTTTTARPGAHSADVTADDQGNISDSLQLPDWFIATYYVTATGGASGTATTTFTDGNNKIVASAGSTFTLTKTHYTNTTCSVGAGSPATVTGVDDTSGNTTPLSTGESEKFDAAATADSGEPFINWTSGSPFTVLTSTATCVAGITTGGTRTYTANYVTDSAPSVTTTAPADLATNVATNASITVNFSEPVTVDDTSPVWLSLSCTLSGTHGPHTTSGGGTSWTYHPTALFVNNETCTVTVKAAQIHDTDTFDPPDNMDANYVFSFTTASSANSPPDPGTISGTSPVDEASQHSYSSNASDPDAGDTLLYTWSVSSGNATINGSNSGSSVTLDFGDGPSTVVLHLVVDDQHGHTASAPDKSITVNNVAPTGTLGNNGPISEGGMAMVSFSGVTDPSSVDAASLHYAFDCAGGSLAAATYAGSSNTTGSTTCSFGNNGTYTVSGKVVDKDGGSNEYTTDVQVNNEAPVVSNLAGDSTVDESGTTTHTYTYDISDFAGDTETATPSCGIGGTLDSSSNTNTGGSFVCKFLDGPASPTVSVYATDSDGDTGNTAMLAVTVNNVKPTVTIDSISGNSGVACISGNTVTLGFHWTDPATTNDTYNYDVNWGDGSTHTTAGFPGATLLYGASPVSGLTHTYGAGGPYTIIVTVNDSDAGSGNTASSSPFSFLYNTSQILQPINYTGPRSSFKIGSTIPVKIMVTDCLANSVSGLTLHVKLQKLDSSANPVNETVVSSVPDVGDMMRYDSTGMQYIYNLSTKRSQLCAEVTCTSTGDLTPGTYRVTVLNSVIAPVSADIDTK